MPRQNDPWVQFSRSARGNARQIAASRQQQQSRWVDRSGRTRKHQRTTLLPRLQKRSTLEPIGTTGSDTNIASTILSQTAFAKALSGLSSTVKLPRIPLRRVDTTQRMAQIQMRKYFAHRARRRSCSTRCSAGTGAADKRLTSQQSSSTKGYSVRVPCGDYKACGVALASASIEVCSPDCYCVIVLKLAQAADGKWMLQPNQERHNTAALSPLSPTSERTAATMGVDLDAFPLLQLCLIPRLPTKLLETSKQQLQSYVRRHHSDAPGEEGDVVFLDFAQRQIECISTELELRSHRQRGAQASSTAVAGRHLLQNIN